MYIKIDIFSSEYGNMLNINYKIYFINLYYKKPI